MPEDDILSSYWLADLGSPDMRSAVGPFFLYDASLHTC